MLGVPCQILPVDLSASVRSFVRALGFVNILEPKTSDYRGVDTQKPDPTVVAAGGS